MPEKVTRGKIAFIVGRPTGHPLHMAYAEAINADIHHEDRILRWQDIPTSGKLRRYISWLLNALLFKNRKRYDIFLCECLRVPPLLIKTFGLMRKNQKLVALMADESLYFLDQNKYPVMTRMLMRLFLKKCDHIICIGSLQYELAVKHSPVGCSSKIHQISNGLERLLAERLLSIPIKINPIHRLVVIANLSEDWRSWYKGVDLSVAAFQECCLENNLRLDIIGSTSPAVKNKLLKGLPDHIAERIGFLGEIKDIPAVLESYDLCLHPSRGDAFPTSTLECFAAGIPTIVSDVTGTKGFVLSVDENLVCQTNVNSVTVALRYALSLDADMRQKLSHGLKASMADCTMENSIRRFKNLVEQIS